MSNPAQLTAKTLVWAYSQGYFPMADPQTREVQWYSADPRGVLKLDSFHCPKSLARRYRSGRYLITTNVCFTQVMEGCSSVERTTPGQWISPEMIKAYTQLHRLGLAHSVEAWLPEETDLPIADRGAAHCQGVGEVDKRHILVGGLYGVHLGSIFFGESMFHRATDASRVCLVHLVERLVKRNFSLLEVQAVNEHTAQFGAQSIPGEEYMKLLDAGLRRQAAW
jgi:leucyl/phenylalanyl-tRNA---protein transferase